MQCECIINAGRRISERAQYSPSTGQHTVPTAAFPSSSVPGWLESTSGRGHATLCLYCLTAVLSYFRFAYNCVHCKRLSYINAVYWVVLSCDFFPVIFIFVCFGQVTGCRECLRNDQNFVGWDIVKRFSLSQSLTPESFLRFVINPRQVMLQPAPSPHCQHFVVIGMAVGCSVDLILKWCVKRAHNFEQPFAPNSVGNIINIVPARWSSVCGQVDTALFPEPQLWFTGWPLCE